MRRWPGWTAAAALVLAVTPAAAQLFGGGKPTIPAQKVLDSYSKTLSTEKINIAPVSAGFGPGPPNTVVDAAAAGLDPNTYRLSLAALQSYVVAIAGAGPRPDVVPRVSFLRTERVNAYAPSQDQIQITTGLYSKIVNNMAKDPESVQQLLFLLAHEYAHILYDHPRRYAENDKPLGVADFTSTGLALAGMANRWSQQAGSGTIVDNDGIGGLESLLALSPMIETELYRVGGGAYRKDAETLADFAAVDLMALVGRGDGRDAASVLLDFERFDNSLVAQLEKGLKDLSGRLKTSMSAFAASAPQTLMAGGVDPVLRGLQGNIADAAAQWVVDFLKKRFDKEKVHVYFSAEKRVDAIKIYADKFHPRAVVTAQSETLAAFGKRNKLASPAALVASFQREFGPDDAAGEALKRNAGGDVAGARALLDAAKAKYPPPAGARSPAAKPAPTNAKPGKGKVTKPPVPAQAAPVPAPGITSAYFHMVDAQTYSLEGKRRDAEAAYERATRLNGVPASAFFELAALQNLDGRPSAALATLDRAAQRFGEASVIIARINHFRGQNQPDAVAAQITRCEAFPDLTKQCKALALQPEPKKT